MSSYSQVELLDEISSGRFGSMMRARDRRTFKNVAVKVARLPTAELYAELAEEVAVLKKVSAKSIFVCHYQQGFFVEGLANYHNGSFDGGTYWIVIEHCSGGRLTDLIDFTPGKSLGEELIAEICASVTTGLHHLHSHGVVHGDLSADNVLLTQRGHCKIGGMRLLASQCPERQTGTGGQTSQRKASTGLSFVAPELAAAGGEANLSAKCDIWALGALAMCMADGRDRSSDDRTVSNAATWSDNFNLFAFSCLAKRPAQRVDASKLLMQPFVATVVKRLHHDNGCSRKLQSAVQAFRGKLRAAQRKRSLISDARHTLESADSWRSTKNIMERPSSKAPAVALQHRLRAHRRPNVLWRKRRPSPTATALVQ